jgi:ABC-2 type transport system ATP-binding protein
MIVVEHLTKRYGALAAVRDVSFEIGRGEVVGFLGRNGAGKTTTLRVLAGFIGMTSGRVNIDGHDVQRDPIRARRLLGYMPETCPLYPEMRVYEYLGFRAAIKGVPRRERRGAVEHATAEVNAKDVLDVPIGQLSKGYRQRIGLADALVARPPLLILDEPTAGLDPNQIRDVRDLIRKLGEEHTILLSTHILSEVEAICDRALVIHHGELVATGTLPELTRQRRAGGAKLLLRAPTLDVSALARAVEGVAVARASRTEASLTELVVDFEPSADAGKTIEALVSALVRADASVREAALDKASLEDVFAALTADSAGEDGGEPST